MGFLQCTQGKNKKGQGWFIGEVQLEISSHYVGKEKAKYIVYTKYIPDSEYHFICILIFLLDIILKWLTLAWQDEPDTSLVD